MPDGPSVKEGKEQVTDNWKPGAKGGAAIAAGNMVLGGSLGPIAGGIAGGMFANSEQDGDNITQTGFMLAGNNLGLQMGGGSSSGSSGGVK